MLRIQKRRWVLLAALAAIPLAGSELAWGQVRVENGRATDANPQVGSGGYNNGGVPAPETVNANQITTGNVTGGKAFRGSTGTVIGPGGVPLNTGNAVTPDPRELRTNVAGQNVDRFIRDSAGSNPVIPGTVMPFYGRRLATPPPPGFVERGFTGTYTPAPQPQQPQTPQSLQFGRAMDATPFLYSSGNELVIPSGTQQNPFISASPLLGVRSWTPRMEPDWSTATLPLRQVNPLDRTRLDNATLEQMRGELLRTSSDQTTTEPGTTSEPDSSNIARPMVSPFESPQNDPLTSKPLSNALENQALANTVRPEQSSINRLPGAEQQSAQYSELQKRLNRYYVDRLQTDEQRNREFLKQLRDREAAAQKNAPKEPTQEGTLPGEAQMPQAQGTIDFGIPDYAKISRELLRNAQAQAQQGNQPPVASDKPDPLQIESLATGIKAPGLANLLRGAEESMKAGKFTTALQQYANAMQVAPNNPLIQLGQAHAELGAGFYRRAYADLRQALLADPTLLMGQFDLKTMIGLDRLQALVKDLKEAATRQQRDAMAPFLLSYLAYNTKNESAAAMYLDEAERREKGDELYRLVRLHWKLPVSGAPATQPAE